MVNEPLRQELLDMQEEDLRLRAQLLAEESPLPYDPRMQEVHHRNAARLREIVAERGWPTRSTVGDDGVYAAWLVLQHAIGDPDLQRGFLHVLLASAERNEIPPWQPAYLLDRIRYFEGKPQVYGTHWATPDGGPAKRWLIEDPEHVNDRRKAVGMEPIPTEPNPMTTDEALQIRADPGFEAWARKVGWF